jgi:hypothetical protein
MEGEVGRVKRDVMIKLTDQSEVTAVMTALVMKTLHRNLICL